MNKSEEEFSVSLSILNPKFLCMLFMTTIFICNYVYTFLPVGRQRCRYSQLWSVHLLKESEKFLQVFFFFCTMDVRFWKLGVLLQVSCCQLVTQFWGVLKTLRHGTLLWVMRGQSLRTLLHLLLLFFLHFLSVVQ